VEKGFSNEQGRESNTEGVVTKSSMNMLNTCEFWGKVRLGNCVESERVGGPGRKRFGIFPLEKVAHTCLVKKRYN